MVLAIIKRVKSLFLEKGKLKRLADDTVVRQLVENHDHHSSDANPMDNKKKQLRSKDTLYLSDD